MMDGTNACIDDKPTFTERKTGSELPTNDKVDFTGQRLETFPSDLQNIQHIKKLCLAKNLIATIPNECCRSFTNLTWLDLRSNKLCILPKSICLIGKLKTLLLDDNKIKILPTELGFLKNLYSLTIRNNPVEFPPAEIISKGTENILRFLRSRQSVEPQDESSAQQDAENLEAKIEVTRSSDCAMIRNGSMGSLSKEPHTDKGLHVEEEKNHSIYRNPELGLVCKDLKDLHLVSHNILNGLLEKEAHVQTLATWKSKLYKKIERHYYRKLRMKDINKHAFEKFVTQSTRHCGLLPDDPPQPTMEKLQTLHKKEKRIKQEQKTKLLQFKAVQKLKDLEKLRAWKEEYLKLQKKIICEQLEKTDEEIKKESRARISHAPFDVDESELNVIDNDGLQAFRLRGIRTKQPPGNLDPHIVLGLELRSMERDKRLMERVNRHLNRVLERSQLSIPDQQDDLRNELIAAKEDLDLAIRLHQQVTRRLETLHHFRGSNRRDLWCS